MEKYPKIVETLTEIPFSMAVDFYELRKSNVKLLPLSVEHKAHSHLGCNEAVIVDLKLAKDVVDLGLGELVSPRLEGVREHLSVDLPCLLSLALVGSECPDDQVVGVVGACGDITYACIIKV